jgi:Transposase family tnp2
MDFQVRQLLELLNWKSRCRIADNSFAWLQKIIKANMPADGGEDDNSPQMSIAPSPLVSKSKKMAIRFLRQFTGLQPKYFDCCPQSCCAFTGDLSDNDICPCGISRYIVIPAINRRQVAQPRKQFYYLPLIPRLLLYYSNATRSQLYQTYPASLLGNQFPGYRDCWDGSLYMEHMKNRDPRHLVLIFFTDGVQAVRQKTHSVWPLMLIQPNLPPDIRYKKENLILVGIIPGPKHPSNLTSFLQPLIDEFKRLEQGVRAWDGYREEWFTLTASLLHIGGDQPACALMMGMKGPRGKHPCRCCDIAGISFKTGYYFPLQSPINVPPNQQRRPEHYDPLYLPYRRRLRETIYQVNGANSPELFRDTSISSLSPFLQLNSVHFPRSFGIDIMHLVLEGVVKLMLSLWMGKVSMDNVEKDRRHNSMHCLEYILDSKTWELIGALMHKARTTVPSVFGRAPRNIFKHHAGFKAVEYWAWLEWYSIPLLYGRMPECYIEHWNILRLAFQRLVAWEITFDESKIVREQLAEFVLTYEKLYYQLHHERISCVTSNIHGLLHIVDYVEVLGPSHCQWSFPIERMCGMVQELARSKVYIDESISTALIFDMYLDMAPFCRKSDLFPTLNDDLEAVETDDEMDEGDNNETDDQVGDKETGHDEIDDKELDGIESDGNEANETREALYVETKII